MQGWYLRLVQGWEVLEFIGFKMFWFLEFLVPWFLVSTLLVFVSKFLSLFLGFNVFWFLGFLVSKFHRFTNSISCFLIDVGPLFKVLKQTVSGFFGKY